MTIAAARALRDGDVCFIGVGPPSRPRSSPGACTPPTSCWSTSRARSAPSRARLPLSIGDGELAETADAVVSVPEMFNYWIGGGRIDVGFLGAAQIDASATSTPP